MDEAATDRERQKILEDVQWLRDRQREVMVKKFLGAVPSVVENLNVKCLGTANAELKDRFGRRADGSEGDGHFRLEFDGFIYQKYGNVLEVTVKDENGKATVFLDPDDLLAAVQWMRRICPVEKND